MPVMEPTLSERAERFVRSVLALDLQIAVFDCDGTLWRPDSGAGFFYWEYQQGMLGEEVWSWILPRYEQYKNGKVAEEVMCGEMVSIHKGLSRDRLHEAAAEYWHSTIPSTNFPEMYKLTHLLKERGVELWAVSSTNNWVVEEGAEYFGIPRQNVLAACLLYDGNVATSRLVRVPSGPDKAVAIREVIDRPVDAVFGNSIHDLAMLELAQFPFAINPSNELRSIARNRHWNIYDPEP